jgi:hypothetical protein
MLNAGFGAGFTVSRGLPTFVVNRFATSGVLSRTLEVYCPASGWQLCNYQAVIGQPHPDPWWFMWAQDSPLQVLGWEQAGGEQSDVVIHALRCCFDDILSDSIEQSWRQLWAMRVDQELPRLPDDASAYVAIHDYFPSEFASFSGSAQQSGRPLLTEVFSTDNPRVFGVMTLLTLVMAVACWRNGQRSLAVLLVAAVATVALNAAVAGSINGVADRQQARIAWLIPFTLWAGVVANILRAAAPRRWSARGLSLPGAVSDGEYSTGRTAAWSSHP